MIKKMINVEVLILLVEKIVESIKVIKLLIEVIG